MVAIEKDMATFKKNMLMKTDMRDVFMEMLPKIVEAVKHS